MMRHTFRSDVRRWLLVALVVAEGRELMHVQGAVEVLKAVVLHIVIMNTITSKVSTYINVHFHLGVAAIGQGVHVWSWMGHIVWK